MIPSWPWVVKGSSATSVITPSSGTASLIDFTARCTSPSALWASSAIKLLLLAPTTGNRAMAGIPSDAISLAWSTNRSMLKRSIPGIEGIASRWPSPSSTKTGKIKSAGVSRLSLTRRRENSLARNRRIRVAGKGPRCELKVMGCPRLKSGKCRAGRVDRRFYIRVRMRAG